METHKPIVVGKGSKTTQIQRIKVDYLYYHKMKTLEMHLIRIVLKWAKISQVRFHKQMFASMGLLNQFRSTLN